MGKQVDYLHLSERWLVALYPIKAIAVPYAMEES